MIKTFALAFLALSTSPAVHAADIVGTWKIHGSVFFNAVDTVCHFKGGGGGGIVATCENEGVPGAFTPAAITDKTVAWSWDAGPAVLSFQSAFTSDTGMKGEIKVRGFTGSFTATKQE
jgi:hypothetical protein